MTRYLQHCDADDFTDKGLHAGDAYQWNTYSNVGTQGGRIAENERMPETGFTITQGSGTIFEFGNSVPYSGRLDDASRHPVKQIIHKALKNDCVKAFETEAHAQFEATPLTARATSTTAVAFTENGSFGGATTGEMLNAHIKLISDQMKERNMVVYNDGNYRCLTRPAAMRAFKDELETLHQHVQEGFQKLLNGEVGRHWEGIRFFEQTFIASKGYSFSDQAFFFGDDTVIEAIVCPPEIRGKLPGDFGRDKGIAWYAEEGFSLVHTVAVDARIYEWGGTS